MTTPLAEPGQIVDLRPLRAELGTVRTATLVKTADMEIIQVVVPVGQVIPTHEAQGQVVLHCLEGRVSLAALGETHELQTGQLLYFRANEPFTIHGIELSSLIVTIVAPKLGPGVELIGESE